MEKVIQNVVFSYKNKTMCLDIILLYDDFAFRGTYYTDFESIKERVR